MAVERPGHAGFEPPLVYWMPSIAVSGMAFYTGDKFPKWKGDVFVGSLRTGEIPGTGHLERILFNEKMQELRRESLLTELQQRIRDVRQGPDGLLYLLTDSDPGAVLRIEPVASRRHVEQIARRMDVLFAGRFAGIPREAFTFFKGLASHNNREWFQANKDVYETRLSRADAEPAGRARARPTASGKLTRINRDMRFARGQAPTRPSSRPVVGRHYISLSKDGLYIGTGIYMPDGGDAATPARGDRRRRVRPEDRWRAWSRRCGASAIRWARTRRRRSAPRGYADDHPRIDLLRMKDIHAGKQLPPSALSTRKALDRVAAVMRDVEPLSAWLKRHVTSA